MWQRYFSLSEISLSALGWGRPECLQKICGNALRHSDCVSAMLGIEFGRSKRSQAMSRIEFRHSERV